MSSSTDNALLVNQLPLTIEFPKEFKDFHEIMTLTYKRIANAANTKIGSLYSLQELGNFKKYYITANPNAFRDSYRKTFDMVNLNGGPIAAGATVSVVHGIVGIKEGATTYGNATTSDVPAKFIPLPYISATLVTNQVEIYVTPTNVVLINGSTQSSLTMASIVFDYMKT